jgi:hypothetical protein
LLRLSPSAIEEVVDRHEAATMPIGIAESWQRRDGFSLGIDRLAAKPSRLCTSAE